MGAVSSSLPLRLRREQGTSDPLFPEIPPQPRQLPDAEIAEDYKPVRETRMMPRGTWLGIVEIIRGQREPLLFPSPPSRVPLHRPSLGWRFEWPPLVPRKSDVRALLIDRHLMRRQCDAERGRIPHRINPCRAQEYEAGQAEPQDGRSIPRTDHGSG